MCLVKTDADVKSSLPCSELFQSSFFYWDPNFELSSVLKPFSNLQVHNFVKQWIPHHYYRPLSIIIIIPIMQVVQVDDDNKDDDDDDALID